jgi:hypothetical protein
MSRTASAAALLIAVMLAGPAAQQNPTIFTTTDFRQDRALWTDPAYYLNNTVGQLRGMALDIIPYETSGQVGDARKYGSEGTGRAGAANLTSAYPHKTAVEHYQARLKAAGGGTKHTVATLPDWSGRWEGGAAFGGQAPASDLVKLLTPEYQQHLVQELKASTEGRIWSAGAFCLPAGFFAAVGAEEFLLTPARVVTLGAGNGNNTTRWIYTDGSPHSPEQFQFAKWHGESIGFWDRDTLIVHTNQIRGWKGGLSEYTDDLETVEQYRRNGDMIEGEITLYDRKVLVRPVTARLRFSRNPESRIELRPLYNTCTDTNGPSTKVFMDEHGLLNVRLPGDPLYWDSTDPRPWGTWLTESDRRFANYRRPSR